MAVKVLNYYILWKPNGEKTWNKGFWMVKFWFSVEKLKLLLLKSISLNEIKPKLTVDVVQFEWPHIFRHN
jgi:hypothetical protein